jgi:hypothetical protein
VSVRGRKPAATRPSAAPQLTEEYRVSGIVDYNKRADEVFVDWQTSYSWESRATIQRQVSRAAWRGYMTAKEYQRRRLVERGFTGPYESGTELGYATKDMASRPGVDMTTAAVGHRLEGDWPQGHCKGHVRWSRVLIACPAARGKAEALQGIRRVLVNQIS